MRTKHQVHSAFVGAWADEACRGLSSAQLLEIHQAAIRAVWGAARTSVSDVALDAVLERVVINARDRFPWLPAIPVLKNTIDISYFHAQRALFTSAEVKKALRFLIADFIAINGNMTAETLSPAMHRALAKVRWKKTLRSANGEQEK